MLIKYRRGHTRPRPRYQMLLAEAVSRILANYSKRSDRPQWQMTRIRAGETSSPKFSGQFVGLTLLDLSSFYGMSQLFLRWFELRID